MQHRELAAENTRPLLYDVYCGAGGAGVGYHRAGFRVVGVDNDPKPLRHYPFPSICMDALEFLERLNRGEFERPAAIHASPPCEFCSEATPPHIRHRLPNLIVPTQKALRTLEIPYVIENVYGALSWLKNPAMLCGSMFGLKVWRHRYFEIWPGWAMSPATCHHVGRPLTLNPGSHARHGRGISSTDTYRREMGIAWMTWKEIIKAIPPTYTEFIGNQLLRHLGLEAPCSTLR